MSNPRLKSFNYAIGMFGTSIPINMLKSFAFIFYVDGLGMTTVQFSLMLLIYTFIDALDNPVYGFLSDRTRTRWGRQTSMAGDRDSIIGPGVHRLLQPTHFSGR